MTADRAQTTAFSIERASRGKVQILSLQGHLGDEEFLGLERELETLWHLSPRRVVLDCSRLTSIASINLVRLFFVAQNFLNHRGDFRLAGLSLSSRKLACAVGLDPALELQPDVETALKSLTGELTSAPEGPEQEPNDHP